MASYQYIFVMQNLTKVFPGGRELEFSFLLLREKEPF